MGVARSVACSAPDGQARLRRFAAKSASARMPVRLARSVAPPPPPPPEDGAGGGVGVGIGVTEGVTVMLVSALAVRPIASVIVSRIV